MSNNNKRYMNKFFLAILLFFIVINFVHAQNLLDRNYLDSVRARYKINYNIPNVKNSCSKTSNIPDSVFLKSYPFTVDSIVIYKMNYEYCDGYYDFLNNYEMKDLTKIATMSKNEIAQFADLIFNYTFILDNAKAGYYFSYVTRDNPRSFYNKLTPYEFESDSIIYPIDHFISPNLIFIFYNKYVTNYLGIYYDGNFPIRIASNLQDSNFNFISYFGDCCPDRDERLKDFFRSTYNYEIRKCKDFGDVDIQDIPN